MVSWFYLYLIQQKLWTNPAIFAVTIIIDICIFIGVFSVFREIINNCIQVVDNYVRCKYKVIRQNRRESKNDNN